MMSVVNVRRKRSDRPSAQFEIQPKIANDFLWEQTHKIGIARYSRVIIREQSLRSRRSADIVIFFQPQHAQPSAAKVSRRHKSIVAGAQDHDIVTRFHSKLGCDFLLTSNIAPRTSNISRPDTDEPHPKNDIFTGGL